MNKFVFIIWNNGLRYKKRILNELNDKFKIINFFYVKWDKAEFDNNLYSFYGHKLLYPSDKKLVCGVKKFLFIYLEDLNPNYIVNDENEKINLNTYNIKMKYRKMMVGGHSIHSSNNEIETDYNMTVLFGLKYNEIVENVKSNSIINVNTSSVYELQSFGDFCDAINKINECKIYKDGNTILLLSKSKLDINYYLRQISNDNKYGIKLGNIDYSVYILGVEEGEISQKSYDNFTDDNSHLLIRFFDEYLNYLNNKCEKNNNIDFVEPGDSKIVYYKKMSILRRFALRLRIILFKFLGINI